MIQMDEKLFDIKLSSSLGAMMEQEQDDLFEPPKQPIIRPCSCDLSQISELALDSAPILSLVSSMSMICEESMSDSMGSEQMEQETKETLKGPRKRSYKSYFEAATKGLALCVKHLDYVEPSSKKRIKLV